MKFILQIAEYSCVWYIRGSINMNYSLNSIVMPYCKVEITYV